MKLFEQITVKLSMINNKQTNSSEPLKKTPNLLMQWKLSPVPTPQPLKLYISFKHNEKISNVLHIQPSDSLVAEMLSQLSERVKLNCECAFVILNQQEFLVDPNIKVADAFKDMQMIVVETDAYQLSQKFITENVKALSNYMSSSLDSSSVKSSDRKRDKKFFEK